MVLVCKNINQRFNINTYHDNLIKNKKISIYDVINENACNNKEYLENNLTKIYYEDIRGITEDKLIDVSINKTIQKDMLFIKNFIKIDK
jgi:hypothetical protein